MFAADDVSRERRRLSTSGFRRRDLQSSQIRFKHITMPDFNSGLMIRGFRGCNVVCVIVTCSTLVRVGYSEGW